MQDLTALSYEEVYVFLCDLCGGIVQLKDSWELVHQLDLETALGLLSENEACPFSAGRHP